MEKQREAVRQVDRTHTPAPVMPAFVTQAYGWGYQDGSTGERRRGFLYWTLTDPSQEEYEAGYLAAIEADDYILFVL